MITLRLTKLAEADIARGCPWIMTHQAIPSSEWQTAPPGMLTRVETLKGQFVGIGLLNPQSHILCRMLSRKDEPIDEAWLTARLTQALAKREALYDAPFYRLAHAEADFLPGLVIDRYGEHLVVQVSSVGMEQRQSLWLASLHAVLKPESILLRNDIAARTKEGLAGEVKAVHGAPPKRVWVNENGCDYAADVWEGQKTGWFYDMRDNRAMVAELAKGKTMLDVFSHSGGFGVLAAKRGAAHVTMVDASALALSLAMEAAVRNGVAERCDTMQADAVKVMAELAVQGKQYDIVIADPPAYVKSKKDVASGMRGYAKVAENAARLVVPGGVLFTASCSHHASRGAFNQAVLDGIAKAGRKARIIRQSGASRDHPTHPQLPQNEYLKGLLLQV